MEVEVAAVLNGDPGDNTRAGGYPDNGVSAGRVAQADYQIITQTNAHGMPSTYKDDPI